MDLFRRLTGTYKSENENLIQASKLSETPGIQLLNRLRWDIRDNPNDLETITIDGEPLTYTNVRILDTPIQLDTSNLVLKLRLTPYSPERDVIFRTGNKVSPSEILEAIYSYYADPYTYSDIYLSGLDEIGRQFPEFKRTHLRILLNFIDYQDIIARFPEYRNYLLKRVVGMGDHTHYNRLIVNPDGSLYPIITGAQF